MTDSFQVFLSNASTLYTHEPVDYRNDSVSPNDPDDKTNDPVNQYDPDVKTKGYNDNLNDPNVNTTNGVVLT